MLGALLKSLKGGSGSAPAAHIGQFAHDGPRPETGRPATVVEEIFWNHDGPVIHKWHHYLPLYDRHFTPWRDKPLRMLEIGVSKGGSLAMWRRFFGTEAVIFGIDIDPTCARFDGIDGRVRIGSQADAAFLASVVAEMGGVDIVLDDGSHMSGHMRSSLETLFPLLSDGGLYVIEDLHAAYWQDFGGGYRAEGSFMTTIKTMIDDMHHWYHDRGQVIAATSGHLAAMHLYDSMAVLEKRAVAAPRHSMRGHE